MRHLGPAVSIVGLAFSLAAYVVHPTLLIGLGLLLVACSTSAIVYMFYGRRSQ